MRGKGYGSVILRPKREKSPLRLLRGKGYGYRYFSHKVRENVGYTNTVTKGKRGTIGTNRAATEARENSEGGY